jgi:multidrug efflux pump subunit AcrA (membrane-fusion protein)
MSTVLPDLKSNGKPGRRRSMLAPVAYSESVMPALRLARSSRIARKIAHVLMVMLILVTVVMAFAPWQQFVMGSGNVVAFEPLLREQTIESPIRGRVVRWGEGIHENARVEAGQLIVELRDLDEHLADRLKLHLENAEQGRDHAEQQVESAKLVVEFAQNAVETIETSIRFLRDNLNDTRLAQDALVRAQEQRVTAEREQLSEFEAAIPQLQFQHERFKQAVAEDIIAGLTFQEIDRALREAEAKVRRGKGRVGAEEEGLEAARQTRNAQLSFVQSQIEQAEAQLRNARQNVSNQQQNLAAAEQSLRRARQEVLTYETRLAQQQNQNILAPFDGFLVKVNANLNTRIMSEGDPIAVIVPDTDDRAVQLWMDGNDAPLIREGRHVRLQFEGWPAVQFAGWPSVAVGTFGGTVVSVDATDDGRGNFRILIKPDDPSEYEIPEDLGPLERLLTAKTPYQPWPDQRFLRQGVRVNGWVLLDIVPLWFEVWRQLNGFPPVVDEPFGASE